MIEKIFQDINQNGWSITENLLGKDKLLQINKYFEEHQKEFSPAKVGQKSHRKRNEKVRGDLTFWLDVLNPPEPFSEVFSFLSKLKLGMNTHFYLGLQEFEAHLAHYPVGTYYKKHLDRFEKDSSRSLSFIFYLHESWDEKSGGELVLYDQDGKVLKEIIPLPGSFICFLSSDFPHEVKPAFKERRSLTGWMHTKIIN